MAVYLFHVNGQKLDGEGLEFDQFADARNEALRLVGDTIHDMARRDRTDMQMTVKVTDEAGLLLLLLDFAGTESPAVSPDGRWAGQAG